MTTPARSTRPGTIPTRCPTPASTVTGAARCSPATTLRSRRRTTSRRAHDEHAYDEHDEPDDDDHGPYLGDDGVRHAPHPQRGVLPGRAAGAGRRRRRARVRRLRGHGQGPGPVRQRRRLPRRGQGLGDLRGQGGRHRRRHRPQPQGRGRGGQRRGVHRRRRGRPRLQRHPGRLLRPQRGDVGRVRARAPRGPRQPAPVRGHRARGAARRGRPQDAGEGHRDPAGRLPGGDQARPGDRAARLREGQPGGLPLPGDLRGAAERRRRRRAVA